MDEANLLFKDNMYLEGMMFVSEVEPRPLSMGMPRS